jgi:hypothetical protein
MPVDRLRFFRDYASAMHEGDAALFVGAGFSRTAGFVDWKNLLRECARELNLDVDRESDLVAVAQYHLNRSGRDRSRLNQILKDEFDKPGSLTKNHEIIGRLPVQTVWTTNFDTLLEAAYKAADKSVDIKATDRSLATSKKGRDVTIYKMHGDIATPDEVIICKDDYERYARKHEIFQNALEGHLVSKTFLFLGFSFTDPNLDYMLGHLRSLLEDSKREHFAVMRRISRRDFPRGARGQNNFEYERNKQDLRVEDLQRYSIHTLWVDEYHEVTAILQELERRYLFRNIFVSGSAADFGAFGEERMLDLCSRVGGGIIRGGHNLVSGFGQGIGSAIIMGALAELYGGKKGEVDRRLLLRPFPQKQLSGAEKATFERRYREDMIARCGFAIFIAGNKNGDKEAPGVLKEYETVKASLKIPIPIGATGSAAKRIWESIEPDLQTVYGGAVSEKLFRRLNDASLKNEDLVAATFEVIRNVESGQRVGSPPPRKKPQGASRAKRTRGRGVVPSRTHRTH